MVMLSVPLFSPALRAGRDVDELARENHSDIRLRLWWLQCLRRNEPRGETDGWARYRSRCSLGISMTACTEACGLVHVQKTFGHGIAPSPLGRGQGVRVHGRPSRPWGPSPYPSPRGRGNTGAWPTRSVISILGMRNIPSPMPSMSMSTIAGRERQDAKVICCSPCVCAMAAVGQQRGMGYWGGAARCSGLGCSPVPGRPGNPPQRRPAGCRRALRRRGIALAGSPRGTRAHRHRSTSHRRSP